MELFFPELGLFIWTVFAFGVFLFVMKKMAWKPLLKILNDRERSVSEALLMAEQARNEYAELENQHQKILKEAQDERMKLLQETRNERTQILSETKEEAIQNATKIIESARLEIQQEKEAAFQELKNEIARFSIQIAETILKQKLENEKAQQQLIDEYMKDMKIN